MQPFLFDLDDTLFDHHHSTRVALAAIQPALPGIRDVTLDVLEELHALVLEPLHQEVLRGTLSVDEARIERMRRLVRGQRAHADRPAIEAAAADYRAAYLAARRPVPGAVALLAALHASGPIAVITNNVTVEQTAKIDVCGLAAHIDAVICSDAAGVAKPDPAIFRAALDAIGAGDEAVMVGDSWHADVLGARAAGLRAAWFNPRRHPCPDPGAVLDLAGWEPPAEVVRTLRAWAARVSR